MRYFGSVVTDVGIVKTTNQDSASIQIADIAGYGQTALISVCDGMGGLAKGELASATVIQRLRWWFSHELPGKMPQLSWEAISAEWTKMLREENEKLLQYGKKHSVSLGTTCSAMLLVSDRYMIAHVGDSRVYKITDHVQQVTEDQTFINREVQAGRMTPQEAAVNPKRNMLLQCVGASRVVTPDILFGTVEPDTVYMLCSDGFRHVLTPAEMYAHFAPEKLPNITAMEQNCVELVEAVKKRNERDNITVALLKSVL